MSQYPYNVPPYQPPPAGYGGYGVPDPLGPAKRAGILSIVIGALMLLCGTCVASFYFVPIEQLPPEQAAEFQKLEEQVRAQAGVGLRPLALTFGIILLLPSLLLIIFGFLVRRGGTGAIVTLMVITGLLLLGGLFELIGGITQIGAGPQFVTGLCMMAIPLALLGLLMYFLVAALRAVPRVRATREQQQSQYWQYQQHHQMYGQPPPPYPFGQQQPPPPPPPPQQGAGYDPFDKRE